jgi:hypothetical protein
MESARDFDGFTYFSPYWIWESGFWSAICMNVCMCTFLMPEWLNRFYLYLVFKSLFIIWTFLSKSRGSLYRVQKQNDFLEKKSSKFCLIVSNLWRSLRKLTVCTLGAQMQDVSFSETSFMGQVNFIVIWYSAASDWSTKQHLFCFQGNIVSISHIWEVWEISFYQVLYLFWETIGKVTDRNSAAPLRSIHIILHWSFHTRSVSCTTFVRNFRIIGHRTIPAHTFLQACCIYSLQNCVLYQFY